MKTATREVSFHLENGFLAKHARRLLLEDNWREAIRLLTELPTPALSLDNAVKVLKGELDIKGNLHGEMELVAQDINDAEFKKHVSQLRWQKAGIFDVEGKFYQASEEIWGFGEHDEKFALDHLKLCEMWATPDAYRKARAKFYTQHVPGSIVCFDAAPNPVLFRLVCDPPFWMPTFRDEATAFADFQKVRSSSLDTLGDNPGSVRSDSFQFYVNALLADVLTDGGDYRLPGRDGECLSELLERYYAAMEQLEEIDNAGEPAFDEKGYSITRERVIEELAEAAEVMGYQMQIEKQAEKVGGFLELPVRTPEGEQVIRIPATPFLYWARRAGHSVKSEMTLPAWKPVCPSGMKMMNDSAMHTDWWIGAGLPLKDAYLDNHPVTEAAYRYAVSFARTNGAQCLRLAGNGKVVGTVVFPGKGEGVPAGSIAVVKNAGTDYEMALLSACKEGAGVVIAGTGGKLAHLTTVSRELGARLVVVDDAMNVFKEGQTVAVDLDKGTFEVLIYSRDHDD